MQIYDCKVNRLFNPLGFNMDETIFSWKVKETNGTSQKDARIIVQDHENNIIFDTGFTSLSSNATKLSFQVLPRTRYYWTVTVRTNQDEICTSDLHWFETGKRNEKWIGQWITCKEGDRHPIFTKKIKLKKEIKTARLYVCGLGLYEAYFNNEKIGDEHLTPFCNNYNQWIQYQTYDVTNIMKQDGYLSILLGNGWYKGRFGFDNFVESGFYGNEYKLIAELHITYADLETDIISTNEEWDVQRSNITFSSIYDGEQRDDTLPLIKSEKAICCSKPKGKLTERFSPKVTIHETFTPIQIDSVSNDETVLDMGQEFTGIFSLKVNEPFGTKIHIQTGEILQNGKFYRDNLRSAKSEYIYTSDGKEKTITPHFTFYGYRYVRIKGIRNFHKEDFKGLALYSDIPSTGTIKTGHALVNQLFSNITWGMKSNFLDVPTDCPQRDERMGWTGDAQVFSKAATYLSDTYAFYRKFLFDLYSEQKDFNGKVPEVVPSVGKNKTSSAWGDAACIIPWNIYQFYNDTSILACQYDSMRAWVNYIYTIDNSNHSWRDEFHYGDWLALDHPLGKEAGFLGGTDERFVADVYYAISLDILVKSATILNKKEDVKFYSSLEKKQREWIFKEYYTQTGRCCIRTQTAYLLTIAYNLSFNQEDAIQMLKRLLDENEGKLKTGFVGTPLLCDILSKCKLDSYAYDLLLNEEYPGWLNEVKLGATTIWERWNSLDATGMITGTQMNSMNHYAAGSIAEWMFKYMAGIRKKNEFDGFNNILIAPQLDRRMQFVEASYESVYGLYESKWSFVDDSHVKINISIPFNTKATFILNEHSEELTTGQYEFIFDVGASRKTYTIDSSFRELLQNEKIKQFLNSLIPLETIPKEFRSMSFKELAIRFGDAKEEQLNQINEIIKNL